VAWDAVVARLLPNGGHVGVPGGQAAFDYFLPLLSAFHLSRAHRIRLPGGRGLFSAVERGEKAEDVLRGAGFADEAPMMIDRSAAVDLTIWRRAP